MTEYRRPVFSKERPSCKGCKYARPYDGGKYMCFHEEHKGAIMFDGCCTDYTPDDNMYVEFGIGGQRLHRVTLPMGISLDDMVRELKVFAFDTELMYMDHLRKGETE